METRLPDPIHKALKLFLRNSLQQAENRVLRLAEELVLSQEVSVTAVSNLLAACLGLLWVLDFRGNRLVRLIAKALRRTAKR